MIYDDITHFVNIYKKVYIYANICVLIYIYIHLLSSKKKKKKRNKAEDKYIPTIICLIFTCLLTIFLFNSLTQSIQR